MNRYDRHTGLSKDVIGTALHTDIFHIMPSDYEAIQKSLMEGKPLGPATSFGKSVVAWWIAWPEARKRPKEKQFALRSALSVLPHVIATHRNILIDYTEAEALDARGSVHE